MKLLLTTAIALAGLGVGAPPPKQPPADKPMRLALMCMKTGEETSGMNKICYYDCGGSRAAITVSITDLCPPSIDR
jgi:hypothetical protein